MILLKDKIMYVTMIKAGLLTTKKVALMAGVSIRAVQYWVKLDKQFGMCLDKAVAFRHAKI